MKIKKFIILAVVMFMLCPAVQAAETETFAGDPYKTLESDNIYVKRMQGFAKRDKEAYKKDKSGKLMWMVWGYTAPESDLRSDSTLGQYAMEAMNKKLTEFQKTPNSNVWDLTDILPVLFMWTRAETMPKEYSTWLSQLKPSMDQLYQHTERYFSDAAGTLLINELLQIAGDLQCASVLYDNEQWSKRAAELIQLCKPHQNEDGAFDYYGHSGTINTYFNFESCWLGWYYQFSRDEEARQMLVKMTGCGVDMLGYGYQTPHEGPWWKYDFFWGGCMAAPEVVAGVAKDPLMRSIAQYRADSYGQDHISVYMASFFYDKDIPIVEFPEDICRYTTNTEGPKLRHGNWYVSMQNKARAASAVTAAYTEKKFTKGSFMEFANTMVYEPGKKLMPIYNGQSYFAVAEGQEFDKGIVVGEDFIAQGKTWKPSLTSTSHKEPLAEDYRNIQIWFADGEGVAGWLELKAEAAATSGGVTGVVKTNTTDAKMGENKNEFKQGQIKYRAMGEAVESVSMADEAHFFVNLKGGTGKSFKKEESIGWGLSAAPLESELCTVTILKTSPVLEAKITRGDDLEVVLAFNPNEDAKEYQNGAGKAAVYLSGEDPKAAVKNEWTGSVKLEKNQLAVLFLKRPEITQLDQASEYAGGVQIQYPEIENPFTDCEAHWALPDILSMVSAGLVHGKTQTSFAPEQTITRSEFFMMVQRAMGIEDVPYEHEFEDVKAQDWFADGLAAMKKAGLIHQAFYLDGMFKPDRSITREEMCALLSQSCKMLEFTMPAPETQFPDEDKIAPWCRQAVKDAYGLSLVEGFEDGTFAPKEKATRAQAAVILKRFFERIHPDGYEFEPQKSV